MLRRRPIFLLLALWLAAASAQAATVFVTQTGDTSGDLGTLRDALNNRVSPGDTVVIQVRRIRFENPLFIDTDGLTILGNGVALVPARGVNTPIVVRSHGVTLHDLTVRDIEISAEPAVAGPDLRGFTLSGSRLNGESYVYVSRVRDCRVHGNRINTRLDDAITLSFTHGCEITDNWTNAPGLAISDLESRDLTVINNEIVGRGWLHLATETALVQGNRVSGRGGIFVDNAVPDDLVRVLGNRAPWMIVERANVEVIGNYLETPADAPRSNVLRVFNESPGGARGPVVIRDNDIVGGQYGLYYLGGGDRAGDAWITDNRVSGCSRRGMVIGTTERLQIRSNRVSGCGSGGTGIGIDLLGPVRQALLVEDNDVTGIDGVGVRLRPPNADATLVVEANRIFDNIAHGILVRAGVSLPVEPPEAPPSDTEPPPDVNPGAGAADPGILLLRDNAITGNGGHGLHADMEAAASLLGGRVSGNGGAGAFADVGARLAVRGVAFEDNTGPGIDLAPAGVSPNDVVKDANADIDWPEALAIDGRHRLTGTTAPNAAVDVYGVEPSPRTGNPDNGEGQVHLGTVLADAAGRFEYPADGALACEEGALLTTTASLGDAAGWTSEFSTNLPCVLPDPEETDSDGDGVVDADDGCPGTSPGTEVGADGCPVEPGNRPPVADAGEATPARVGDTVVLDGSGSSDPDGDPLIFVWYFVAAPDGSTAALSSADTSMPSFVPDRPGTYLVWLEVSDGIDTNSDQVTIEVADANRAPVADATASAPAVVGEVVLLDGSGSTDEDGDPLTFAWTVLDAPADSVAEVVGADAVQATFTPDQPGTYRIELLVGDGALESRTEVVVHAGVAVTLSFARILCFDQQRCDFPADESSGGCSNCMAYFNDSSTLRCGTDTAAIVLVSPGELAGTDCASLATPDATFGCEPGQCSHVNDGGSMCSGAPEVCRPVDDEGQRIDDLCDDGDRICDYRVGPGRDLGPGDRSLPYAVGVSKLAEGGNGTFGFEIENLGWTTNVDPGWTVSTEDGTGTRRLVILFADDNGVTITEQSQELWSARSACSDGANAVIGDATITPSSADGGPTWDCVFTNTQRPDSDGDGVWDGADQCPFHAGTDGRACPAELTNDLVHMFCVDELNCSLNNDTGNCGNCVVERTDGSASIACDTDGACFVREGDTLECQGSCTWETPAMSGACGVNTICTHDTSFYCQADATGNGCDGTLPDGQPLACPEGAETCSIRVPPNILAGPDSSAAHLDIGKTSIGGNGSFHFTWVIRFSGPVTDSTIEDGDFYIVTRNGVGQSVERIYFDPSVNQVSVRELPLDPFELTEIACDPPEHVVLDLSFQYIEDVGNTATCTFINQRPEPPPTGVFPLPDGATGVGESTLLPDGAFGLTGRPFGTFGTATGSIVVDVTTGEVPFAGNERLSFTGDGFPAYGALVLINPVEPDADVLDAYGPTSVTRQFDPATGQMGFGVLGFDNITQTVPLGGDRNAEVALRVNASRNRIDLIEIDPNSGLWRTRPVIEPENLQNLVNPVVSAFANDLGRLDCSNPCETSGAPMPAQCSAEIDEVLASEPSCAESWGGFCVNLYNSNTGGFCDLPGPERQVNFGGMVLGVTGGQPSELFLADPALNFFGRARILGTVGDDAHRVTCLNGLCVVVSTGSDQLTVLTWDGLFDAQIVGTVPISDAPEGASMRELPDGNIAVRTTGRNDGTLREIVLTPDGLVLSNDASPAPAECDGPAWPLDLGGFSADLISCTGSAGFTLWFR